MHTGLAKGLATLQEKVVEVSVGHGRFSIEQVLRCVSRELEAGCVHIIFNGILRTISRGV